MRGLKFIAITACILIILLPPVQSSADTSGTGTDSAVSALQQLCNVSMTQQNGQLQVFTVGVSCFENLINGSSGGTPLAETAITDLSGYLADAVYAMLVLYLIFFGAQISLGVHTGDAVKKEFMIHALKVAFVAWLIFSLGLIDVYGLVQQSYGALIQIVMSGANLGDCSNGGAAASSASNSSNGFPTSGTAQVWATMDCMLSKFVGWEATNGYGTQYKNVPLFFGIIFSKMLPANGFIIGGILFSALWSLMSGFFRLAFVYLLSLIALVLLFAVAPIIVPLMLFKQTKNYFDSWTRLVVAMVLQPVILFAFFALIASMMMQTITQMEQLFTTLKATFQTSSVDRTGNTNNYNQLPIFDSISSAVSNMDAQTLLNGITTFVIAYLLISFINYVSQMALELAGAASGPNLGNLSDQVFNIGI